MTDDSYITIDDDTIPEPEPPPEPPPEPAVAAPAPQAPPEEEPAAPVAPEEDEDIAAQAVEDGRTGQRLVPLDAVLETRRKSKEKTDILSAQVGELEARARQAEERAQQYEAYVRQLAEAQQRTPQPQHPAQPDREAAEHQQQALRARAEKIAKRLDLYTPDGKPDVERGMEILTEQVEVARSQAAELTRPLQQELSRSRSDANRAALSAHLARINAKVDPRLFNQLWSHLTPELTAQQEVAAVAAAAAIGWPQLFGEQAPAAVQQSVQQAHPMPNQPVVTEPVQQRHAAPRLTGGLARAAKELGLTAADVEQRFNGSQNWSVLDSDVND